jgi:Methyltransferase domain
MLSHLRIRWYHARVALYAALLRRLGRSDAAWVALDRAGVRGHGLHLLRFDFPPVPPAGPSWGYGAPPHPLTEAWLRPEETAILARARQLLDFLPELNHLPEDGSAAAPLAWRNQFQTPLDIAFDYGLLRQLAPRRYIEVGSGVSTLVAAAASARGSGFEITSIDPHPRADIDRFAQHIIRRPLEDCVDLLAAESGPDTVLFIDGSHFAFPGSDVTRFFLDVLPRLRAGTVVHVHDIYLPDDYPARHLGRLWNEQYLLACWLSGGGNRLKPILPGHWLASRIAPSLSAQPSLPEGFLRVFAEMPDASCWWMTVT